MTTVFFYGSSSDGFIVTYEAFIASAPLPRRLDTLDIEIFQGGVQRELPCQGVPTLRVYLQLGGDSCFIANAERQSSRTKRNAIQ